MGKRFNEYAMIDKGDYKYINLEFIYDMADGEEEFVVEIVNNCLEAIGPNLQKLSEAIQAEDKQTTQFLAHKLRGSFKFIGCNEAGETVGQIEDLMKRNEPFTGALLLIIAAVEKYKNIEQELVSFLKEISNNH